MKKTAKKILALAIVASMLLGTFVSCSSSEPSQAPSSSEAPSSASAATSTPADTSQSEAPTETTGGVITLTDEEADLSVRSVTAENGVVASASPIASKVGLEILKQGGNAVDAAVATAFALGMVEPNASGIGGDGFMLYYEAATGKTTFLDYKCEVPSAFTDAYYRSMGTPYDGGLAVTVPGFVAGMYKANELFGTMDMEDLMKPARDFAVEGTPVTSFMATTYLDTFDTIQASEGLAEIYLNNGLPYMEGEIFKNPEYATSLDLLAEHGPDVYYKGEIAEAIVKAVTAAGGVVTMEDLANYEVEVKEPFETTYHDYTVVTTAPPSGGLTVLESLNMAENFDIASMGHNSVEALHIWSEIFKRSAEDRYTYNADPNFYDIAPMEALITKEYAKYRISDISLDTALPIEDVKAGITTEYESPSTTHVSIVDSEGNMIAMTNTIGAFWGSDVVVDGYGFVLNAQASNISKVWDVNNANAGMKIRSTIAPLFMFDAEGNPVLTAGSPGASRILTTNAQIISGIVDFDMDLQEAIEQPRISQYHNDGLEIEGHMPDEVVAGLEAKGHDIIMMPEWDYYFGGVQGVEIDPDTGELHGAADPRRDGKALGY